MFCYPQLKERSDLVTCWHLCLGRQFAMPSNSLQSIYPLIILRARDGQTKTLDAVEQLSCIRESEA